MEYCPLCTREKLFFARYSVSYTHLDVYKRQGLNSCYTFEPEGNGEAFAKNGIVVVTVEQRLGVFGYLSLPQLSEEQGQSGNYGLMDQIKAMEWIKENIANFGGDVYKRQHLFC